MGRRRKRRRRGARARANVELGAHIASLGLESKRDYRRWRRDHGLSGGLQGTWRERTAERKILARDVAREAIRAERVASVEAVRVASMDPWFAWCRQHGAGWSAGRSRSRLARAVSAECGRRGDAALLAARGVSHRPGRMIQKLRAGELSRDDMMTAQHTSVFDAFALADRQPGAGEALRRLVACVGASHETLSLEPVVREFGRRPGNTQLGGLSALALRQGECRRPPEDWAPTTHNARRRFGSLARWLLTTYDVPRFLDTAWFAGQRLEARAQQQWFVDVGLGRNIRRSAHLPVVLTKRMAHLLMHGGETVAVSVAMRRAQVLGMGGSEALARAVTRSRLGGSFEHEEFWVSVVKFLVDLLRDSARKIAESRCP